MIYTNGICIFCCYFFRCCCYGTVELFFVIHFFCIIIIIITITGHGKRRMMACWVGTKKGVDDRTKDNLKV